MGTMALLVVVLLITLMQTAKATPPSGNSTEKAIPSPIPTNANSTVKATPPPIPPNGNSTGKATPPPIPPNGNSTVKAIPLTGKCTRELLGLSPCLSYVSSPPNNLSSWPSPRCCPGLKASTQNCSNNNGNGCEACLCDLLRNPSLFGFPVDTLRFIPLVSQCHLNDKNTTPIEYLRSLCRGFQISPPAAPPMRTPSGSHASPRPKRAPSAEDSKISSNSFRILPGITVLFLVIATTFIISTLTELSS